jgi:hypothetical protein
MALRGKADQERRCLVEVHVVPGTRVGRGSAETLHDINRSEEKPPLISAVRCAGSHINAMYYGMNLVPLPETQLTIPSVGEHIRAIPRAPHL